ncbi:hypothetical protein BT63DRAFT_437090 [Microthyrium microscopicum]|uniref:Uncharacterized protein n=1 Tax=Microthyrium microscopicum TaxID=703497 RepID=A0A6A6UNL7_9PEZI|nr:hypothetical protein BT63DRAFT_437090 [Microthyrium microscopicum]
MSQPAANQKPVARRIRPVIPLNYGKSKSARLQAANRAANAHQTGAAPIADKKVVTGKPGTLQESTTKPASEVSVNTSIVEPKEQAHVNLASPGDSFSENNTGKTHPLNPHALSFQLQSQSNHPSIESDDTKPSAIPTESPPSSASATFSATTNDENMPIMPPNGVPFTRHNPEYSYSSQSSVYMPPNVNQFSAPVNGHHTGPPPGFLPPQPNAAHMNFPSSGAQSNGMPPFHSAPAGPPPQTSPIAWNPAANFTPPSHGFPQPVNGHGLSRSGSQSSSMLEGYGPQGMMPYPQAMFGPPPEMIAVANWVASHFSNRDFADYALDIFGPKGNSRLPDFPAHAMIMARSPTLRDLMHAQSNPDRNPKGQKILGLEVPESLTTATAVAEVIGSLYGLPLPTFDHSSYGSVGNDSVLQALALAGAGLYLNLPSASIHGVRHAIANLTWENLEAVFAFAQQTLYATLDEHLIRDSALKVFYDNFARDLLARINSYVIDHFPAKFELHHSAPEWTSAPRLPIPMETRPSISDPRLASIQFGAMPAEETGNVKRNILLSTYLVSSPTNLLQELLESPLLGERLGWQKLAEVIQDAVDERERRRLKVIKTKRVLPGATQRHWETTKYRESMVAEPRAPTGFILDRSRHDTHVQK